MTNRSNRPAETRSIDHPDIGRATGGRMVASLRALGVDPSDIEVIAVTHLHTDHIGWAHAYVAGKPVFDPARIVLSSEGCGARAESLYQGVAQDMLDRMADRVVTVKTDGEIWPGVHALATFGHTPGHTSYLAGDDTNRHRREASQQDPDHSSGMASGP